MSKLNKCLLLAACSGVCLVAWLFLLPEIFPEPATYVKWRWALLQEIFSLFMIGAVICLVFGTPILLLIEKYFSRFTLRYIIGGPVAAWVMWFITFNPLLTGDPWLDPDTWLPVPKSQVQIYVAMGLATGTLFTIVLAVISYFKKRSSS